jgi:hypothetical protein
LAQEWINYFVKVIHFFFAFFGSIHFTS